ncbi:NlpC/P60 family protein [Polymorphospora rubra]|uniref:C40 family peptidase n=1 Tax=Polymorphospora rubra TaxID=338584 RepID=UPI0034094550
MADHAPWRRPYRSATAGRPPALPRLRRSTRTTVFVAVASVALVLFGAVPAQAEPTVAEIEAQIDKSWSQLEPVIEQHNATREQLATKKKQADALTAKITPLQLQVDLAMERVGQFATRAYKGGNTSALNSILTNGSPQTLADQLELLDQFARRQARDIQSVVDLKAQYTAEKGPLDTLVAQLTTTEAELAAKTKQINADIKKLQDLRLKAYGSSGGLGSLRPAPCPATYPGGPASTVAKFACSQIGKPYVWGASGPGGYDCSGLMLAAWGKVGVRLPHNAAAQRRMMPSISRSELRPGDFVFYNSDLSHVGMYVGDGWLVHASQAGVPVLMKRYDNGTIHSFGRPRL